MVSANKNPSKGAAVGMTSHLCGRNVSSVRMAFATNGRWTYWDRATIELKSNKDRELPNEPNRPVKRLRAGREISRFDSSPSDRDTPPDSPEADQRHNHLQRMFSGGLHASLGALRMRGSR